MKLSTLNAEANTPIPPRTVGGGSSTLLYGGIPFDLDSDSALLIELDESEAQYFSFQTYRPGWFDAGDFANH
jgi:hypothetical protein